MNIPDDVLDEVRTLDFDKEYQFIAEWARKEALREAAELTVSMADNEPDGYYGQACYEVASALRALAEGGAQ